MIIERINKTDSGQIVLLLNDAQKLVLHVRSSPNINNSIDITTINQDEDDRPDPLRLPEIIIVLCVLLLWLGSILIFIRHSELLRIRHRDIPYRSSNKSPMNLNHITVVRRTSDMVIHSKPRFSAGNVSTSTKYDYESSPPIFTSHRYPNRHKHSFDSNIPDSKQSHQHEQFLDPQMISPNIRRSLLDLHRKSMDNLSMMRHSMSYSTNDVSRNESTDENHLTVNQRCVQESPV